MTQAIIILCTIALAMAVLALVGVGIVMYNIKSDKPPDSYYKIGGTDNDDTEPVIKNEQPK